MPFRADADLVGSPEPIVATDEPTSSLSDALR